jgi:hypothetical protein
MAGSHERGKLLTAGIPCFGNQPSILTALQFKDWSRQSAKRLTDSERLLVKGPFSAPLKSQDADRLTMRVKWD